MSNQWYRDLEDELPCGHTRSRGELGPSRTPGLLLVRVTGPRDKKTTAYQSRLEVLKYRVILQVWKVVDRGE